MYSSSLPALVIVFYVTSISCYSLPNEARYVGCYTTDFSRKNENGFEVSPLTYEVCMQLCYEKDTRYAGVEAGKSTCYCGNNLAQQSEKVAPYMCDEECYAEKTKTCGGDDNLLSLYMIKNTSSFSFLATTDNGLAYFKNNLLTDNFAILPRISEIKATYHFAENTVYFHANRQIYKSEYKALLQEHMSPQVLMELRADASSLALDWVHKNLFWALPNSIVMSKLDGSNREEIVKTDHPALDLTVDPYDRQLLFINNGTVIRFDLKSEKVGNQDLFKFNRFNRVTNIAVDLHKKIVYAIGYYDHKENGDKYLVSTDYQGVMFRVLLRRRELTGAFSISALNDQLFWAEYSRGQRALYSYNVPMQSVSVQPKKLSSLPQNVVGAVLYHEDAQTRGETYFCQKLKCSHICTYTLETSAKCGCPQLMILGKDHKTCKDIPGIKRMQDESHESGEFDDEIFELSLEVSSEDEHRNSSSKRKHRRGRRSRKGRMDSSNSEIKSRSLPFTKLFNPSNITMLNATV